MGTVKVIGSILFFLAGIVTGYAQSEIDLIVQQYESFYKENLDVRVQLIFNQNKYAPTDTAYFISYIVADNKLHREGKHLITINLIDAQGNLRLRQLVKVTDGEGSNQIIIPEDIGAGFYNVVAYGDWTGKFDSLKVFKYEIEIVAKNQLVRDVPASLAASVEGGHLIAGVFNKVVIQASPPGERLQLTTDEGQALQLFKTDNNGFASVTFMPEINKRYYIERENESKTYALPVPQADGCSIIATSSQSEGPLKVMVSSPEGSAYRKEELIILLSANGKIYSSGKFKFDGKVFVPLEIRQEDLPNGVVHLSILSTSGNAIASRQFYVSKPEPIQVDIKTNKQIYSTREKITLNVNLKDNHGNPLEGDFLIRVTNKTLLDYKNELQFRDDLSISPFINRPFINQRVDSGWAAYLDQYLILNSHPLPWERIMAKRVNSASTAWADFEKRGTVYYGDSDELVPAQSRILFYLQKAGWWYQTTILDKGMVGLTLPDFYGVDELFYIIETKNGKELNKVRIAWESDENMVFPQAFRSHESDESDSYASFVENTRMINQSYGFYTKEDKPTTMSNPMTPLSNLESFMIPDISVNSEEYISFSSMDELIREIVPSLFVRRTKRNVIVRVSLLSPLIPTHDPVYIIDGIATKNTQYFLSLDPTEISNIKLINNPKKLLPLGLMGENGIVMVRTKRGELREPIDSASLVMGQSLPHPFISADYSSSGNNVHPDFKSTLYWNPSVITDADGVAKLEFYSSDDIVDWNISIKGFTKQGLPFSANHQFTVGPRVE